MTTSGPCTAPDVVDVVALTAPGDLAAPPSRHHADRLAALDDTGWGRLRLGPGWTQAEEDLEEVRTP